MNLQQWLLCIALLSTFNCFQVLGPFNVVTALAEDKLPVQVHNQTLSQAAQQPQQQQALETIKEGQRSENKQLAPDNTKQEQRSENKQLAPDNTKQEQHSENKQLAPDNTKEGQRSENKQPTSDRTKEEGSSINQQGKLPESGETDNGQSLGNQQPHQAPISNNPTETTSSTATTSKHQSDASSFGWLNIVLLAVAALCLIALVVYATLCFMRWKKTKRIHKEQAIENLDAAWRAPIGRAHVPSSPHSQSGQLGTSQPVQHMPNAWTHQVQPYPQYLQSSLYPKASNGLGSDWQSTVTTQLSSAYQHPMPPAIQPYQPRVPHASHQDPSMLNGAQMYQEPVYPTPSFHGVPDTAYSQTTMLADRRLDFQHDAGDSRSYSPLVGAPLRQEYVVPAQARMTTYSIAETEYAVEYRDADPEDEGLPVVNSFDRRIDTSRMLPPSQTSANEQDVDDHQYLPSVDVAPHFRWSNAPNSQGACGPEAAERHNVDASDNSHSAILLRSNMDSQIPFSY